MTWDCNVVTEVRHVRDHVLFIGFDDGLAGELDFLGYMKRGPVFQPLVDESFFKRVHISGGTVAWPNGADIAPERLYEMLSAAVAGKGRRVTARAQ